MGSVLKPRPSFFNGYATHGASQAPELWKGNVGDYAPFLGRQGKKLFDFNGFGKHGAINGPIWSNKSYGSTLEWNSSTDYIDLGDNYNFGNGITDKPFSFICDVEFKSLTSREGYLISRMEGQNEYRLYLEEAGPKRFTLQLFDNSTGGIISQSIPWVGVLATNTRYQLGFSYVGNGIAAGINLFKNGVLLSTTPKTSGVYVAMENASTKCLLGRIRTNLARSLDGFMGQVSVFKRALSENEFRNFYLNQFARYQRAFNPAIFEAAGAIMNQFQGPNLGADLFNGSFM